MFYSFMGNIPRQSEVCNLDDVWPAGEDVLGLEVSVEEAKSVHVREALGKKMWGKTLLLKKEDSGNKSARYFFAICAGGIRDDEVVLTYVGTIHLRAGEKNIAFEFSE